MEPDDDRIPVRVDARSRAVRTALQGMALTVAAAAVGVLAVEIGGLEWTWRWWAALGLLVAKSAAQAGVAYLHRVVVPPPS